jgi:hypothetical protein
MSRRIKKATYANLKKCIHGLKQASRAWHTKFNDFLLKFGLTQSSADPFVLFRHQNGEVMIVAIYVDDGLVMSNKNTFSRKLLSTLELIFKFDAYQ